MIQLRSPLTVQFVAHWKQLCRDGHIPSNEDYLDHPNAQIVPYLMIFDCLQNEMLVRFQGSAIGSRRGIDQTGHGWFQLNPHLKHSNIIKNAHVWMNHPCGFWTLAQFVTNAQRGLTVEALSLPVLVKANRPQRWINLSVELDAMAYDERATGWQGPIEIGWFDLGFGMPPSVPLPVA